MYACVHAYIHASVCVCVCVRARACRLASVCTCVCIVIVVVLPHSGSSASSLQRLQLLLLNPLKELSNVLHADIRQKQLECVLQILQSLGDSLGPGWPLVLGVIGAIRNDQG